MNDFTEIINKSNTLAMQKLKELHKEEFTKLYENYKKQLGWKKTCNKERDGETKFLILSAIKSNNEISRRDLMKITKKSYTTIYNHLIDLEVQDEIF